MLPKMKLGSVITPNYIIQKQQVKKLFGIGNSDNGNMISLTNIVTIYDLCEQSRKNLIPKA